MKKSTLKSPRRKPRPPRRAAVGAPAVTASEESFKALKEKIGNEALPPDLAKSTGAKTWKELIVRNAYRKATKSPQFFQALLPRRKQQPRGKPFEPGNEWRFPTGATKNPGGRPKRLGESLVKLLEQEDPATKKSMAELLGEKMIEDAMNGSTADRREIRLATEGETIHTPDMLQVFIDR